MKRKFSVIIAVFMIVSMIISVGGCSLFGEEEPAPDIVLSDLIGSWTRETNKGTESYVFQDNMKCTHNNAGVSYIGEFSISGNELTEVYLETHTTRTHIVRFSEDKNTMYWGTGSTMAEYTRVK